MTLNMGEGLGSIVFVGAVPGSICSSSKRSKRPKSWPLFSTK